MVCQGVSQSGTGLACLAESLIRPVCSGRKRQATGGTPTAHLPGAAPLRCLADVRISGLQPVAPCHVAAAEALVGRQQLSTAHFTRRRRELQKGCRSSGRPAAAAWRPGSRFFADRVIVA